MKAIKSMVFFLLMLNWAYGQKSDLGVKAGANWSTLGGEAENVDIRLGYHFGIFCTYSITQNWLLQPEFVFSSQGAVAEDNSAIRFRYQYVNFPILIKWCKDKLFLNFGPQVGVLVDGKVIDNLTDDQETVTSQLENFDFSVAAGFGFALSKKVAFELRYNQGISDTSIDTNFNDQNEPNRVFQFSAQFFLK